MGQKCNPIGNRLGIVKGWDSNWYGGKKFASKLVEDDQIRKYLNARLSKAGISHIIIERTLKLVTVTINTARPGIIIGKAGQEVDKLKEELKKLTGKEVQINISEIKRPELDAVIVGNTIARQLEGRIPLHTLRADIDYALAEAQTTYGKLGIKTWIMKGEIYGKVDLVPGTDNLVKDNKPAHGQGRPDRKGGPRGDRDRDRGSDRGGDRGGDRRPRNKK